MGRRSFAVHQLLSLGVLWLHLLAMAIMLGGAALLWWLARSSDAERHDILLPAARLYERLFWAAAGVGVMTGVGNLGALGADLPSRGSAWGDTLTIKLILVTIGAMLSLTRTLMVAQTHPAAARRSLCLAYGATTAAIAAVAGLGVLLAGD